MLSRAKNPLISNYNITAFAFARSQHGTIGRPQHVYIEFESSQELSREINYQTKLIDQSNQSLNGDGFYSSETKN